MFIKLSEIIPAVQLCESLKDQSLPVKTLYKLALLKREAEFHLLFYKNNLQKVIEEYGERNETGELKKTPDGLEILINKEKINLCQEQINELLNLSIEIPDIYFSIEEFNNIEMTFSEFQFLVPFIKD